MAQIREELYLADAFSQTFRNFDAAANAAIHVAEEFQRSLEEFSSGFLDGLISELNTSRDELYSMAGAADQAAAAQDRITRAAAGTEDKIIDATEEQNKFTESVQKTERMANNLLSTVGKVAGAVGVVKLTNNFVETADEMAQITAKLNMINDGYQTTAELQNKIFESAQKTRSAYMDTANIVSRLGMNASSAFRSNSEMLRFAENLNKSFKIAGASAQEQSSVLLQLSQSLAGGFLRGQEFTTIAQSAPNIMGYIAREINVSKGALKDMAAEGEITAEVIRDAMLNATDDINEKFGQIPQTFGDIITTAKDKITFSLSDAFSEWTNTLNGEEVQAKIDDVTNKIADFATSAAGAFVEITKNIDTIVPALEGAGAAVLTFKGLNLLAAQDVGAAWASAFSEINPMIAAGGVGLAVFLGRKTKEESDAVNKTLADKAKERGFNTVADYLAHYDITLTSGGRTSSGTGGYYPGSSAADLAKRFVDPAEEAARVANKAAWYQAMYDGTRASAEKALRDQKMLYEMYKQEYILNHPAEVVSGGQPLPVKVVNEVRLSDEDLKMFRDIAENRYINNINLETAAPVINNYIENNGAEMDADTMADKLAGVIVGQMSEHTAISHG